MSQKVVMEIPANPMLSDSRKKRRNLRVAAYCRVSTEEEEQKNSFEVQVSYYTDKITHHEMAAGRNFRGRWDLRRQHQKQRAIQ